MKIVATIACRNNSRRLYAKPLQLLQERTVLDFLMMQLQAQKEIDDVVLAISEMPGNEAFIAYAKEKNIKYVTGDDRDVLGRLIKACELVNGNVVFRITSESPFPYLEGLPFAREKFQKEKSDYLSYSKLPDGCNFELINLEALKTSHKNGEYRHRSELCTLYINENKDKFKLTILEIDKNLERPNYRLTIDFPEDLILCRRVVNALGGDNRYLPYKEIIKFLDDHPVDRALVENITDSSYIKPYH